jgi:protocatechuate 3,4-dioxygenase beta subunit
MTDSEGRYGFDTIRPGSYPGESIPQHIHLQVIEPGCATYYIDDVVFVDDPLLDEDFRRRLPMRGGNGEVIPVRDGDRWLASRDIDLGRNIPGYACPDKAG